ncbi:MAG: hypothetical protein ACD_34C00158G0001 [uncultured bacterium]|nr:MAG: hypothetical protein ACD_34C00158G0001 [uncultured bacterium]
MTDVTHLFIGQFFVLWNIKNKIVGLILKHIYFFLIHNSILFGLTGRLLKFATKTYHFLLEGRFIIFSQKQT